MLDYYASFVNLDSREDRLTHMKDQLERVGIKATRTRGLLPQEVKNDRTIVMERRTPGAIGCWYSQVGIMQAALGMNKHAFVMEDDLIFCQDFEDRLAYIELWMQENDWDVFWLGGTFHSPAYWHCKGPSKMMPDCSAQLGYDMKPTEDPRIVRTYGAFCTYAYIVNKKSLDKVLTLLDENIHVSIGIDWAFIKIQPQLKAFAFVPGSVKQMDNESNIGEGVTRFSGFSKLNGSTENSVYWYQDKMESFDPTKWQWL